MSRSSLFILISLTHLCPYKTFNLCRSNCPDAGLAITSCELPAGPAPYSGIMARPFEFPDWRCESYPELWVYPSAEGVMSGPYSLAQLHEGMVSRYLPQNFPVYPLVNGSVSWAVPLDIAVGHLAHHPPLGGPVIQEPGHTGTICPANMVRHDISGANSQHPDLLETQAGDVTTDSKFECQSSERGAGGESQEVGVSLDERNVASGQVSGRFDSVENEAVAPSWPASVSTPAVACASNLSSVPEGSLGYESGNTCVDGAKFGGQEGVVGNAQEQCMSIMHFGLVSSTEEGTQKKSQQVHFCNCILYRNVCMLPARMSYSHGFGHVATGSVSGERL